MKQIMKRVSAWLPLAISLACIGIVILHIARYGTARLPDETGDVHLFQLLMLLQLPVIAYFALRWLPQNPRQGFLVLVLQGAAIVTAWAPIFFFEHVI